MRVARAHDITEADAAAEGISQSIVGSCLDHLKYRAGYQTMWNQIYGTWDANPWVWVIEFRRV